MTLRVLSWNWRLRVLLLISAPFLRQIRGSLKLVLLPLWYAIVLVIVAFLIVILVVVILTFFSRCFCICAMVKLIFRSSIYWVFCRNIWLTSILRFLFFIFRWIIHGLFHHFALIIRSAHFHLHYWLSFLKLFLSLFLLMLSLLLFKQLYLFFSLFLKLLHFLFLQ